MQASTLTLYGTWRSRTWRVLWMLAELGLPYEHVETDTESGATRAPELLRLNPNGHVPVLVDGDVVLYESLAINLYLARRYGPSLWPHTIADEGRALQWTLWTVTELEPPLFTVLKQRTVVPEAERDPALEAAAAAHFPTPVAVLDGALAARPWLAGDDFTVADLNVASVLAWAPLAGLRLGAASHARAWLRRCVSRPAFERLPRP